MAVRFLNRDVSDLCLGKPALRSIPENATVAEALMLLKRSGETHVSVWNCDHSSSFLEKAKADDDDGCHCVGKISMVDVICFLSKQENLIDSSKAFEVPISKLLPKGDSIVRHLDPNSRFVLLFC
uniref:CBS domain-containing protein n=1 Tax=Solanum tuberosum TaxID=4113 RepID=M1AZ00_SOLTU